MRPGFELGETIACGRDVADEDERLDLVAAEPEDRWVAEADGLEGRSSRREVSDGVARAARGQGRKSPGSSKVRPHGLVSAGDRQRFALARRPVRLVDPTLMRGDGGACQQGARAGIAR